VARRVILATGGRALPKSGSDGAGWRWRPGSVTSSSRDPSPQPVDFVDGPALAPDPAARAFAELSGLTVEARLELLEKSSGGRRLFAWTTASCSPTSA